MARFVSISVFCLLLICISGCSAPEKEPDSKQPAFQLKVPPGFPQPDIPEDNQLTEERIALGKKLFYDPILSLDSTLSCRSCHFQHRAFSDTVNLSKGVHGLTSLRNAQPLINVAYNTSFFRDGGVPTLEQQIIVPIQTEEEMNLNILTAVERLKKHPVYPALIQKAYQREVDPFAITRAIASFVRTLISGNSRYDQYIQGTTTTLNEKELAGMELFFGDRLNCKACHEGFNFSNQLLENNGLYETYENDPGREHITLRPEDRGKFKVPTLRNVSLTAPYMHDGSLNTLEDVIDHYASGGKESPNKSKLITGFDITPGEKKSLVAFLKALTDQEFIENPAFNP